ncbi:hypothetical protein EMPG_15815 [Blastomyces silverae]|uniref:Uncharacterized protein n=1 Tax=Blastomyces silverae TaxID=2060906 RepID=A0A0H1BCH7_9EURO|nr:hypothetical protein EMPG_15815 [Blastomyces silverae]
MDHIFPSLHDAGPLRTTPRLHHSTALKCCCGSSQCAYLQHNSAALADLEKDVETAAQLGQRHESYMTDAEGDRSKLLLEMEHLERDKRQAQAENARIIEENRELLEQLEEMNKLIVESDAQIKSLTDSLESTQLHVKQLSISASRVAQLEWQIVAMEKEQEELHAKLIVTEEDEKSAIQRWRQAECTLRDLQDQLERIEKESREEQERHVELLARMERRRAVERELDSAAGRLKGAAAASSLGQNKPGVVSNFVRDILQDNANLQMGIVELREMLQNSNEEVQNLREQVLLHQPLTPEPNERQSRQKALPLSDELDAKFPPLASQEFHVHHHYHTPTPVVSQRKERVQIPIHRRQRRKRPMISSPLLESPRISSRMSPTSHRPHGSASSTSTILSQTSVSIPPPSNGRNWSTQASGSAVAGSLSSSMPSSPQSTYRTSSIFDRVDHGFESSRPTSPESIGFASPSARPYRHRKGSFDVPFRSISGPAELQDMSVFLPGDETQEQSGDLSADENIPYCEPPILEEAENLSTQETIHEEPTQSQPSTCPPEPEPAHEPEPEPELSSQLQYHTVKRASSHDSLISISGMDIHTLRSRPSQMLSHYSAFPVRTPSPAADPNATPTPTPPGSLPSNSSPLHHPDDVFASRQTASFSKRVGGWVLGRWGMTPITLARESRSPISSRRSSLASSARPPAPPLISAASSVYASSVSSSTTASTTLGRPAGVNQKGPIPGLRPPAKAPTAIQPKAIDEESLQESLLE